MEEGFILVLSGGGVRGFAHIGVLKALEELGLEPRMVIGTSAGAVVAAYWGLGYTADQMMQRAESLNNSDLFVPVLPNLGQPVLKEFFRVSFLNGNCAGISAFKHLKISRNQLP
jgi:NTE family protein